MPTAQELLRRFLQGGRGALAGLNGDYVAILVDQNGELVWETDFAGLQPLYYYLDSAEHTLYFSSELKALVTVESFRRDVDPDAVAYMLGMGYVASDLTLFKHARLSLPHSSYAYDGQALRHSLHNRVSYQTVPMAEREAVDRLFSAVSASVVDRIEPSRRVFLPLSAGLDSRLLLGVLQKEARTEAVEMMCCTYGRENSYDYQYAPTLAEAAGFPHASLVLRPDYMARFLSTGTWLLEATGNCAHFHQLTLCEPHAAFGGTCLSGIFGNLVSGSQFLIPDDPNASEAAYASRLASTIETTQGVFSRAELRGMVRPGLGESLDCPWEMIRGTFHNAPQGPYCKRTSYVQLIHAVYRHHVRLFSLSGAVELPFADLKVLQTAMQMEPALLRSQRAYRKMIARYLPELAAVPSSKGGVPVLSSTTAWRLARILTKVRNCLRPKDSPVRYALYDEWLRGESRGVLDVILNGLEYLAPYLDPAAVRKLVADTLAGRNRRKDSFRKVSTLATLVAWQRLFVDESWKVNPEELRLLLFGKQRTPERTAGSAIGD